MAHTVVGIFDSKEEAQAAMNELVQRGFIREDIDVSNRNVINETVAAADTNTKTGDSISNFFRNLFGGDEKTARNYSDVARDTEGIVTVQTDTSEKANQAAQILDKNGAVDVEERAAQYRQNYAQTSETAQNQTINQNQAINNDRINPAFDENRMNRTVADERMNSTVNDERMNSTVNDDRVNRTISEDRTDQTANDERMNRTANQSEMTIPVVEESLQVGKRTVETGGVRVRSRIVEKPVEETLRLRQEHIVVDRRPVDRAATEADFNNFKEGDIEITERAERAVVGKEARVVGEVAIGKTVEEHDKTITDTVRKTEVEVEKLNSDVDAARRTNN